MRNSPVGYKPTVPFRGTYGIFFKLSEYIVSIDQGESIMGMSHDHVHSHVTNARDVSPVLEVDIMNAYDASEYAGLEECLRGLPGVTAVHLDRTRGVAHLGYDPAVTTPEAFEGYLSRCGYRCDCYGRPGSVVQKYGLQQAEL
jgi:hypothetical protein